MFPLLVRIWYTGKKACNLPTNRSAGENTGLTHQPSRSASNLGEASLLECENLCGPWRYLRNTRRGATAVPSGGANDVLGGGQKDLDRSAGSRHFYACRRALCASGSTFSFRARSAGRARHHEAIRAGNTIAPHGPSIEAMRGARSKNYRYSASFLKARLRAKIATAPNTNRPAASCVKPLGSGTVTEA
jgi:hypothetical protein